MEDARDGLLQLELDHPEELEDCRDDDDALLYGGGQDEPDSSRRSSFAGFTNSLTLSWFVSVFGVEHCHTYFWITKDLAWMQGLRSASIFFGLLALAWSLLILYHAIRTVNWHELWNFIALFLWLFANFLWMRGEAHDSEFPDELPIAPEYSYYSSLLLEFALLWALAYYLICVPLNLIHTSRESLLEYDDGTLRARCGVFRSFRQYENLHMVFWIAKDLAWNRQNLFFWLASLFPTVYISIDLLIIILTTPGEEYIVDATHFTITLVWVVANSVWAFGDFFIKQYDAPVGIWNISEDSLMTARWYSAWILFFDMCLVFLMYAVWGVLTLLGVLTTAEVVKPIGSKHSMTSLVMGMGMRTPGGNGSPTPKPLWVSGTVQRVQRSLSALISKMGGGSPSKPDSYKHDPPNLTPVRPPDPPLPLPRTKSKI